MRETTYSFAKNLFNPNQIKEINELVQKNFNHQTLLGSSGSRRLRKNQRKKIGRDKDT